MANQYYDTRLYLAIRILGIAYFTNSSAFNTKMQSSMNFSVRIIGQYTLICHISEQEKLRHSPKILLFAYTKYGCR